MQELIPEGDKERLAVLNNYEILDTIPDKAFDDIAKLAANICETQTAYITFVDAERTWYKSSFGLEVDEVPRELSFCAFAILKPEETTVIPELQNHEVFKDNPAVVGGPQFSFYAGVPLMSPQGYALGTICVADMKPHELSSFQLEALEILSRRVISMLELYRSKITQERLGKELEVQNKQLERFASEAAHDLRSPLSNISMATDTILREHKNDLNDEVVSLIELVNKSSSKLLGLTNEMLEQSKASHVLRQNKDIFDFNDSIKSVMDLIDFKGTVDIVYPKQSKVFANRTAVEQILLNLVSNAINYNDKGTTVLTFDVKENDQFLEFKVGDNGPGIKEEDRKKIFERFQRGSKPESGKNFGIGLSTVKRLVEGMEGEIKIDSELGEGTTFTFSAKK